MVGDPLDRPPADHGSDRYDYVELIGAPAGVKPDGIWWDRLIATPCPDCRANIFATWTPRHGMSAANAGARQYWEIKIAHDATCPNLQQLEGG